MSELETKALFKIILFGMGHTGKTTLAHKYIYNTFLQDTQMTIGCDFYTKILNIFNVEIKLQIWDFAGENRFKFLLPSYASGAMGGFFVYDVTNSASLDVLPLWLSTLHQSVNSIPIIMVGTKIDLVECRQVSYEYAKSIAREHNLSGYSEVSSKTGVNVEQTFELIAELMLKHNLPHLIS